MKIVRGVEWPKKQNRVWGYSWAALLGSMAVDEVVRIDPEPGDDLNSVRSILTVSAQNLGVFIQTKMADNALYVRITRKWKHEMVSEWEREDRIVDLQR